MSERVFILHLRAGNKVVKESDAIAEAERQEKAGITPHYAWRDYKTGEITTPPGWLVWSTHEDGAGVVYRRKKDGKMILTTGWQGDFVCF